MFLNVDLKIIAKLQNNTKTLHIENIYSDNGENMLSLQKEGEKRERKKKQKRKESQLLKTLSNLLKILNNISHVTLNSLVDFTRTTSTTPLASFHQADL